MPKNYIRSFAVVVSITIIALIIDTSISNISDIISIRSLVSSFSFSNSLIQWNFFAIIAVVYGIGQYSILRFIKQIKNDNNKLNRNRPRYLNVIDKIMRVIQYCAITPLIAIIILQMLVSSQYVTGLITAALTVSYLLSITIFLILSIQFFSWFYFSFKLTDNDGTSTRNIMLLLYALASATTAAALVFTLIFYDIVLLEKPPVTEMHSEVIFPYFYPNSTMGSINSIYSMLNVISFLLLWISSAKLLRHFSKGLGNLRFWTIVGIPLVYFISQFIVLMPLVPQADSGSAPYGDKNMFTIIFYSLQGLVGGILFGIPFLDLARRIKKVYKGSSSTKITEYMVATAFGFMLTYVSGTATVIQTPYPPFGLASVSFLGLSSYLVFVGLYNSAITVSQDVKLRQAIRKVAINELKLIDSIGTAQMERELQKRVLKIAKLTSSNIQEESGYQSSMTEDEIKKYLQFVMEEIEERKKTSGKSTNANANKSTKNAKEDGLN